MKAGVGTVARLVWIEGLRRKDAYILLVLLGILLLALSMYDAPVDMPVGRYMLDAGLLMTWIFSLVLTVILAARQVPADLASGMAAAVLSKPLDRTGWLIGKWVGVWSVVTATTLVFYAAVAALGLARGGMVFSAVWVQALGLHIGALALVSALALALSTRLTAGAAITVGLIGAGVCWGFLPTIGEQAAISGGLGGTVLQGLYFALPHLEVLDLRRRLVHAWGPAPGGIVALSAVYAIAWTVLGLLLARLGFRRRSVGRGTAG